MCVYNNVKSCKKLFHGISVFSSLRKGRGKTHQIKERIFHVVNANNESEKRAASTTSSKRKSNAMMLASEVEQSTGSIKYVFINFTSLRLSLALCMKYARQEVGVLTRNNYRKENSSRIPKHSISIF